MLSKDVQSFSKDSTTPLFDFLNITLRMLANWIDESPFDEHLLSSLDRPNLNQTASMKAIIGAVKDICGFVTDVFHASHIEQFDGGRFQARLMIGRALANQIQNIQGMHELGLTLAKNLGSFDTTWKLSTGGSMEVLWDYFKPPTCLAITHVDALIKLEGLATKFDSIVWRSISPFDTLLQLRQSLVAAFQELGANLVGSDRLFEVGRLEGI